MESEPLLADIDDIAWWVDSTSSCHIAKMRACFVEMKEKKSDDHRMYMENNTYYDILGVGTTKITIPKEKNI